MPEGQGTCRGAARLAVAAGGARSPVLASLRGEGSDGLRCPPAPGASGRGTATDMRRGVDDLLQAPQQSGSVPDTQGS